MKEISRRDFMKLGLAAACELLAWEIAIINSDELNFRLESREKQNISPKLATVGLFDPETRIFGAGTFITPRHILTCSHLGVGNSFVVIPGNNYLENFKSKNFFTGIHRVSDYGLADVSIVTLDKEQNKIAPAKLVDFDLPEGKYRANLTLADTHLLFRRDKYAGEKFVISDRSEFGRSKQRASYIFLANSASTFGTSGTGLYLESSNSLLGVSSGGNAEFLKLITGPGSYYVNLGNRRLQNWISNEIKT